MALPKRSGYPYSTAHHTVVKERIITVIICLLLVGTGFYTTPWLKYIDQDAAEIGEHYPRHGSSHSNNPLDDSGFKAGIEDNLDD